MEGHSCIRTKVLAEDVSSDGQYKCSNLHHPGDEKMTVEQAKLVLLNVTIISRESPICNTLMKKTQEEPKNQATGWKYDAIEGTFE
jgi:hypothetical protein